jgi:thymidine kinase
MEPFYEIVKIMPWTTRVEKCTAVCHSCKGPALYTWRKPDAGLDEILVGGVETYEARCGGCHPLFKVK